MLTKSFSQSYNLIHTLAMNDFRSKHARSAFGLLWLFLTPLGMLLVYWGVFSYTLDITWSNQDGVNIGYVLPFFIGYSLFLVFSEVVTSSLNLFISKKNYVKKSPISLWLLWFANLYRCYLQGGIYLIIIFLIALIQQKISFIGVTFFVVFLFGSIIFISAISLFLSALGPFLNDLSEASRVVLRIMFYSAPVTYPLSLVPENMRYILWFNPLTNIIEPIRNALLFSQFPQVITYSKFIVISIILIFVCVWFFNRAEDAIVDVV